MCGDRVIFFVSFDISVVFGFDSSEEALEIRTHALLQQKY